MIDRYFRAPLLYDYIIGFLACTISCYLYLHGSLKLPKEEYDLSTSSDLSTIALTLAGFILTLLTILITFKAGSKVNRAAPNDDHNVFDLFFATGLYFETTKHLKNCIKSLIFVAVLGFALKLFLNIADLKFLFFSNVLGLIILVLTLWRSVLILTKIIALQKEND